MRQRQELAAAASAALPPLQAGATLRQLTAAETQALIQNEIVHAGESPVASGTDFGAAEHVDGFGSRKSTPIAQQLPIDSAAAADLSEAVAIPHSAPNPSDPQLPKYIPLREVQRRNFLRQHGVHIRADEEITLEHTSCSETEAEVVQRKPQRRRRHKRVRSDDGDEDDDDDDLAAAHAAQKSHARAPNPARLSLTREFGEDEDDDSGRQSTLEQRTASAFNRRRRQIVQQAKRVMGNNVADPNSDSAYDDVDGEEDDDSCAGEDEDDGNVERAAGVVGRMSGCFLCLYGQEEYDSVNNDDYAHLVRLFNNNIGKIDPKCIALIMHQYYTREIRPKALQRGQVLPKWRSKAIFVHITTHTMKPQIQIDRFLRSVGTLIGAMENELVEDRNSREVVNWRNAAEFGRTLRTWGWLSALKAEKMAFFDPKDGVNLADGKAYSQGVALRTDRSVSANKAARQRALKPH